MPEFRFATLGSVFRFRCQVAGWHGLPSFQCNAIESRHRDKPDAPATFFGLRAVYDDSKFPPAGIRSEPIDVCTGEGNRLQLMKMGRDTSSSRFVRDPQVLPGPAWEAFWSSVATPVFFCRRKNNGPADVHTRIVEDPHCGENRGHPPQPNGAQQRLSVLRLSAIFKRSNMNCASQTESEGFLQACACMEATTGSVEVEIGADCRTQVATGIGAGGRHGLQSAGPRGVSRYAAVHSNITACRLDFSQVLRNSDKAETAGKDNSNHLPRVCTPHQRTASSGFAHLNP